MGPGLSHSLTVSPRQITAKGQITAKNHAPRRSGNFARAGLSSDTIPLFERGNSLVQWARRTDAACCLHKFSDSGGRRATRQSRPESRWTGRRLKLELGLGSGIRSKQNRRRQSARLKASGVSRGWAAGSAGSSARTGEPSCPAGAERLIALSGSGFGTVLYALRPSAPHRWTSSFPPAMFHVKRLCSRHTPGQVPSGQAPTDGRRVPCPSCFT
jgi:hypothetical protein